METCGVCGNSVAQEQVTLVRGKKKNAVVSMCPNCVAEAERAFDAETKNPAIGVAILVGLGAATVSALIWYGLVVGTNYLVGWIALGVGWLVGQAVIIGSGKKRGTALQVISVLITIFAMALAEYLIVRHFVILGLKEQGYTSFKTFLPLGTTLSMIGQGIKTEPVTLFFWLIALAEAFAIPRRRRLQVVKQTPTTAPPSAATGAGTPASR